ncbi:MAG: Peptidyl-prolyl cis-trans isomerase, partial [Patescibacteria group bacterium]|nr:Peptidyl-prolyl cis-trans isomerase [Patescibacteria group bacterium]
MNKIYTLIILVVIVGAIYYMRPSSPPVSTSANLYSTSTAQTAPITTTNNQSTNLMHIVTLETNKGTIVFETFDADAPKAVSNFITLANKNYYDGIIFH